MIAALLIVDSTFGFALKLCASGIIDWAASPNCGRPKASADGWECQMSLTVEVST